MAYPTLSSPRDSGRTLSGPFPGNGTAHGFAVDRPAPAGRHSVCILAQNVGAGTDVILACDWKAVVNAPPLGSLDVVQVVGRTLRIGGWALDPDTSSPVTLHVYLRDSIESIVANVNRPGVGAANGRGSNHGFDATFSVGDGPQEVCVYAIDIPPGTNQTVGCGTFQVGATPVGVIDTATTTPGSITVTGWAFDPDTTAPIGVHFYADGQLNAGTTANLSRTDVGAVYSNGDLHGYAVALPATAGTHRVCACAIDSTGGRNPEIDCRVVTD